MATKNSKKQKELDEIAEAIAHCKVCQQDTSGKPVPGEGNPDADIMFIGEAPGKNEAATGRPFIGRAGKLLREGIASIGLNDQDVYITSPVKYLPNSGTPTESQIDHGREHLEQQIAVIEPKVLVLMGRVASLAVLKQNFQLTKDHGRVLRRPDGRMYMLMLHPAAPLYSPQLRADFMKDFKKLKKLLAGLEK